MIKWLQAYNELLEVDLEENSIYDYLNRYSDYDQNSNEIIIKSKILFSSLKMFILLVNKLNSSLNLLTEDGFVGKIVDCMTKAQQSIISYLINTDGTNINDLVLKHFNSLSNTYLIFLKSLNS